MSLQKFKSIHHVDKKTIVKMYDTYKPVFILSTGRTGTQFLALLFQDSKVIEAHHEAFPNLQYFSNFAYHSQKKKGTLEKIIDTARVELMLESYIKDKIYVESNQCLTFYAYALMKLYKNSKFVHIVRHPGDFVRSGIRKGLRISRIDLLRLGVLSNPCVTIIASSS